MYMLLSHDVNFVLRNMLMYLLVQCFACIVLECMFSQSFNLWSLLAQQVTVA